MVLVLPVDIKRAKWNSVKKKKKDLKHHQIAPFTRTSNLWGLRQTDKLSVVWTSSQVI